MHCIPIVPATLDTGVLHSRLSPGSRAIFTITDAEGNLRTAGESVELPAPEGCWMYGDLAVPVCSEADAILTFHQKKRRCLN